MAGPNPITYLEIKAWMDVTGNYLESREVDAILRLDTTYLKVAYE